MLKAWKGVAFASWFLILLSQDLDPAVSAFFGWVVAWAYVRAALALT
jgi:hypothetical protein